MFIADTFVFVELPKTGTTYISKFLPIAFNGVHTDKHQPATPELLASGRKFLGSIRSPWDWYTSMWAFGCLKKGVIFRAVTGPRSKHPDEWLDTYQDINDPVRFRRWVNMMHDPKYMRDTGKPSKAALDTHGWHVYDHQIGLYTSCYLRLFTPPTLWIRALQCTTPSDAKAFDSEHCYISYFIKTENLEQDLLGALRRLGTPLSTDLEQNLLSTLPRNTTPRRPANYYYDTQTSQLISERDKFIFEKFGYPVLPPPPPNPHAPRS